MFLNCKAWSGFQHFSGQNKMIPFKLLPDGEKHEKEIVEIQYDRHFLLDMNLVILKTISWSILPELSRPENQK